MKIVSDHGFPKGDSRPDGDPFDGFKNERDYVAHGGRSKTTVAAMDWAAAEIDKMRKTLNDIEYASRKDSLTDAERLESIRIITFRALGLVGTADR